jgi:phage I-like protein
MKKRTARAAHALDLGAARPVPEWVHLLPLGEIACRDGRGPYRLDDPQGVIAATTAHQKGVPLPIDYDHQLLYSEKNGKPAPAAGWITDLEVREGGIWGRVEWTEAAAAHLAAREYRYLSPVYRYLKHDGTVTRIECAALTNIPNLELTALASQLDNDGGEDMDLNQFLALLAGLFGLSGTPTADGVAAHAKALAERQAAMAGFFAGLAKDFGLADARPEAVAAHAKALNAQGAALVGLFTGLAKDLGLAADAKPEAVAAHARTLKGAGGGVTDPAKFVPMEQFQAVAGRLSALEGDRTREQVEAVVAHAKQAGKLAPAMEEWATAYASKDLAGFKAWVNAAPVVVAPGATGPVGGLPPVSGGLTDMDRAVCSQLGLSEDAYKLHMEGK